MSTRDYNEIDAYDDLRRIGPMFSAAVHELDRLFRLLPQSLVDRIQAAVPETEIDLAVIGPKLTAFAQTLADEVDALPECRQDALCEQIETRRKAEATRPVLWAGPSVPFAPRSSWDGDGPPEAA